jgi:hypothetical protein
MEIRKFNPGVDKSILILMGGTMWCGVGIMLIRYAVSWLSLCSAREQFYFYSAGFLAAMPIHHFGFIKIATRNINRILSLREKTSPFAFMTWKSYLIVLVMVSMGIALRHSSLPKQYLSILYNGIGLGLFLSGIRYLRFFFRLIFEKKV